MCHGAQYDVLPMKRNANNCHIVYGEYNVNKCNKPIENAFFGPLPYIQLDPHTWPFIFGGRTMFGIEIGISRATERCRSGHGEGGNESSTGDVGGVRAQAGYS
jgi:hypothetical protein